MTSRISVNSSTKFSSFREGGQEDKSYIHDSENDTTGKKEVINSKTSL